MLLAEDLSMSRRCWRILAIIVFLSFAPTAGFAQTSNNADVAYNQLAQSFKPLLVSSLPATLYEKTDNWDHQVMVPVGIKWQGLKPQVQKSPRNHGEWRKLIIRGQDLKQTLNVRVYDVKTIDAEKQTFKAFLTMQMNFYYEQQNWESGARLWSASVQARAQVKVDLDCENTLKLELAKNGFPDFILRLRVTGAKISYDNLVFEHVAGIGGDGAKIIGKTAHEAVKKWRPSIERNLLARTSDAIVKAADTKEIRFGFGGLLKTK
jgi:hypothetical protein